MQESDDGAEVRNRETGKLERAEALGGLRARRITSDALFGGANEVVVEHGGEHYRLRRTSKGKLILTK